MPLGHIKKKTIQLQITSQNFSLGEPKSICMSCDMVFMCKLDSNTLCYVSETCRFTIFYCIKCRFNKYIDIDWFSVGFSK